MADDELKGFFMVWCPEGVKPPKKKHKDYKEAEEAARDMAARNPGKLFYVVKALSVTSAARVETRKLS